MSQSYGQSNIFLCFDNRADAWAAGRTAACRHRYTITSPRRTSKQQPKICSPVQKYKAGLSLNPLKNSTKTRVSSYIYKVQTFDWLKAGLKVLQLSSRGFRANTTPPKTGMLWYKCGVEVSKTTINAIFKKTKPHLSDLKKKRIFFVSEQRKSSVKCQLTFLVFSFTNKKLYV